MASRTSLTKEESTEIRMGKKMEDEKKLEQMMASLAKAQKRFDSAFKDNIKKVKEKLDEKKDSFAILGIKIYELPSDCIRNPFVYDISTGVIREHDSGTPIENMDLPTRNRFVNQVLSDWKNMEKRIDNDINCKLATSLRIVGDRLSEIEKGLAIMGIEENMWGEIRNDYFHDDERKVYIDAWETADDNEEGTVIAKVNVDTGEVEYLDERAKSDSYAQEVIGEVLEDIENGVYKDDQERE